MDFHPGGDLATQLAHWDRLSRDQARFCAAEIIEGVEGLHKNGIIYRDLNPENVLIGSDEFRSLEGVPPSIQCYHHSSKWNGDKAHSVARPSNSLLRSPRDSLAVSELTGGVLGRCCMRCWPVLCGPSPLRWEAPSTNRSAQTPFRADNRSDVYSRVLQDALQFPEGRSMDQDTKSFIRGVSVMCLFALRPGH
jgi:serum/glucocorticoid-regulated kinase 2